MRLLFLQLRPSRSLPTEKDNYTAGATLLTKILYYAQNCTRNSPKEFKEILLKIELSNRAHENAICRFSVFSMICCHIP